MLSVLDIAGWRAGPASSPIHFLRENRIGHHSCQENQDFAKAIRFSVKSLSTAPARPASTPAPHVLARSARPISARQHARTPTQLPRQQGSDGRRMGWGADCLPFLISHCPDERHVCVLAGNWSVPMEIGLPEACRGKRSGLWHCHGLTRHPRWAGHGFLVACISSRALAPNEMGLLRLLPTSLWHSSCGCKSSCDGTHRRQHRHSAFVPS